MKALIVDDERLARGELRRLLVAHPDIEVAGEAANPREALERVRELEPELIFLDVQMPGGTGFDVLEQLEDVPLVIFTTAYDQHALRAFEVNALDYLLKPIDPARLSEALERARLRLRPASTSGPREYLERIFVRDGERCWLVNLAEVPLLESEGNYARLHLGKDQPLVGRSLNYLEERLDPKVFFRANRQQMVNLGAIAAIEPGPEGRLCARLTTGREIEMSRRQSQRLRELLSP